MFSEPTRRLPFSPRFSYDGRYGASLVAVLLGAYLLLGANVGLLATQLAGYGGPGASYTVLLASQFVFAGVVLAGGFLIHPATSGRRIGAAALVVLGSAIWFVLFAGRIAGSIRLPAEASIFLAPGFVVTLLAAAGWLLVRERPAISYLLLIATIACGLVPFAMVLANVDSGTSQLVVVPLAAAVGVGIAWAARAIAGGFQRPSAELPPPVG